MMKISLRTFDSVSPCPNIPSSVNSIEKEAFPVKKSYHKKDVALKYLLIHNNHMYVSMNSFNRH